MKTGLRRQNGYIKGLPVQRLPFCSKLRPCEAMPQICFSFQIPDALVFFCKVHCLCSQFGTESHDLYDLSCLKQLYYGKNENIIQVIIGLCPFGLTNYDDLSPPLVTTRGSFEAWVVSLDRMGQHALCPSS